jgi:signal transduction histidine kinase
MDGLVATVSDSDRQAVRAEAELEYLRQENLRLRQETDNFRQTAQLVLNEPDTRGLAQSLARQFGLMLGAESAWVLVLQDRDTIAHGCWPQAGAAKEPVPQLEFGKHASGRAAKSLETCIHPCASGGSEIATPIVDHQRRLLGLLQARRPQPFELEHARLAGAFAVQAALGLERARLFDRMRDWTKSLEMLLSFNAVINQHVEPAQLVRRLVENAARFLEADGGRTGLAVPTQAAAGKVMISDAYWHHGHWQERPGRWEMNEGIPGFLLDSEFSYIANDYREDRLGDASLIADYDVCRALCVPIKNMDESLLGFFELLRGPGRPAFTWQDAAFLESLSNTTAVAIHNAQLLKSLEIKNEQIQALSANHVKRLEAERTHIARELHDEAGQLMIGIKLGLQVLSRTVPAEPPQIREELDRLKDLVNQSTLQIKDLARRLRPPILDQLGLNVTLRQMAADFMARTGINVNCELEELPERLPADSETTLYRIAQEALTNAARYSEASHIDLTLSRHGRILHFRMRDNGAGFNSSRFGSGLGLLGMRERADMLNAEFQLQTSLGNGTQITIAIPYEYCADHPR